MTIPLSVLVTVVENMKAVMFSDEITSANFSLLNDAYAPLIWRVEELLEKQKVEVEA